MAFLERESQYGEHPITSGTRDMATFPTMHTLIEDAMKLQYLTSNSQWARNADAGKDFKTTSTALAVAEQEPIGEFNIVGYFPKTKQLFNMTNGHGKSVQKASAD